MMPLLRATPAQIAQNLHKEISNVQVQISSWTPELQLTTVEQVFDHEQQLQECAKKAETLYYKSASAEIPKISDEEYQTLLIEVEKAASILIAIKENYDIAQKICGFEKEAEKALNRGSPNLRLLESLAGQVQDLFCHSEMNQGNQSAVQSLLGRISSHERPTTPAPTLKRSPAIQLPPASLLQIEEDRKIREEQDLVFEIHKRKDEFTEFCRSLQGIPPNDFDMLISFYAGVKQEFENCLPTSPNIKQLMETVLTQIETEIKRVVALQQGVDAVQATAALNRPALETLKSTLETAYAELANGNRDFQGIGESVEEVFKKLNLELKEQLMDILSEVLKTKPNFVKRIPKTLLNHPFFVWCGSYEYRLEAVQELIASFPAAPSGPTLSSQMIEKLKAVMAPSPKCQYLESLPVFRESITKLQDWIVRLGDDDALNQLYDVLEELTFMMSENDQFSFTFNIGEAALCTIPNRVFFHLSCIHRHQRPKQFRANDPQYAQQAMAGVYPTTNLERRQAVLRTAIEVTLIQFAVACQQADEETCMSSKQDLMKMQKIAGETVMPVEILHTFIMNTHPFKGEERIEEITKFQKRLAAIWKLV
jgi:hypothetical protein